MPNVNTNINILTWETRIKLQTAITLRVANGVEPQSDSDFEKILEKIEESNPRSEIFSLNTLKRLYGKAESCMTRPSSQTKSILAHTLGRTSWENLIADLDDILEVSGASVQTDGEEHVNPNVSCIIPPKNDYANKFLVRNSILEVKYYPGRDLTLEYMGAKQYRVISSTSENLQHNDILTIEHLYVGIPLVAIDVKRNNTHRGCYHSNSLHGIQCVKINGKE